MLCCKNCGGRDFEERANGKTTRAVLRAALALSEGKKLVLYKNEHYRSMWEHPCRYFISVVADVCRQFGYLETQQTHRLTTINGGVLIFAPSSEASCLKGLRPDIREWEVIEAI